MRRPIVLFLLVLTLAFSSAAWRTQPATVEAIELVGPASPVAVRQYVQVQVKDLKPEDYAKARLIWAPSDGATAFAAAPLGGGQPFILFIAYREGSYRLELSVGSADLAKWREKLASSLSAVETVVAAGTDAGATPDTVAALVAAQKVFENEVEKIPGEYGECTIQVGEGPEPPPPPHPDKKPAWCVIITETATSSLETRQIIGSRKLREFLESNRIQAWFQDEDVTDENDNPLPKMQRFLTLLKEKGISVPAMLVQAEDGEVLDARALPGTAEAVIDVLRELSGA